MYLNTLHFHEDMLAYPYPDVKTKLDKQELNLAITLLNTLTKPFEISAFRDEYREKIEQAIQAKIAGKTVYVKEEGDYHPALDLMTALEESLKNIESEARA